MCARVLFVAMLVLVAGCGVPRADYERLRRENETLKAEIDELKNGEDRLAAVIDKAYQEKDYDQVRSSIAALSSKHPESLRLPKYSTLLGKIQELEAAEKAQRTAEEKERVRLANLNNTGIWEVSFYVDRFGERTPEKLIRNSTPISGTFSNTATEDSDLSVFILIDGASKISLQLFEYARNNPVKAVSSDSYTVRVKDRDGKQHDLEAVNYSDRLTCGPDASRKIHSALMKGGQVQFWIQEDETPTTQYRFSIVSADWYDNAYQKFLSKS